jgi:hypothetical protein
VGGHRHGGLNFELARRRFQMKGKGFFGGDFHFRHILAFESERGRKRADTWSAMISSIFGAGKAGFMVRLFHSIFAGRDSARVVASRAAIFAGFQPPVIMVYHWHP